MSRLAVRLSLTVGCYRLAIPLPFPLRPIHLFGAPLPTSDDLNSALVAAQEDSTSWPKTSFGAHDLLAVSASSADLAHSRTILPSSILLAWNLTIRLPEREATALAKLIAGGGLSVYAGRRIVASFDIRGDGGVAKTLKVEAKSSGKRPVSVEAGTGGSDLSVLDIGGWLELSKGDMRSFSTCNGHLHHALVVQLPSLRDLRPVLLEVGLNSSGSTVDPSISSSAPENVADDLPPRPKRAVPPSLASTESGGKGASSAPSAPIARFGESS